MAAGSAADDLPGWRKEKREQSSRTPKTMSSKQQILKAIRAAARRLDRPPTYSEFFSRTGISRYRVSRSFSRWSGAVRAAGLDPIKQGALCQNELLRDWGETVRRKEAMPSRHGYLLDGKYDPRTLEKRFGGWTLVPRAFRKYAGSKREWADVLALLTARKRKEKAPAKKNSHCSIPQNKPRQTELRNRVTYGNPIDFRGLRHEPVNEQGVVFLFGMLAKELGFLVEQCSEGSPTARQSDKSLQSDGRGCTSSLSSRAGISGTMVMTQAVAM